MACVDANFYSAVMHTLTAPLARPGCAPAVMQPQSACRRAALTAPPPNAGWLGRLAVWAERQPRHHRLGCWTVG